MTSSLLMGESTTPAEMLPQLLLPTTLLRRLSLKHSLGPFAHIPSQGLNIHPPALSAIASFLFTQILAPSTSLPSRPISSILYSRTVGPASLLPTVHLLHSLWQTSTRGRRGGMRGLTNRQDTMCPAEKGVHSRTQSDKQAARKTDNSQQSHEKTFSLISRGARRVKQNFISFCSE